MTIDKTTVNKMTTDKMTVDKMTTKKMIVNQMWPLSGVWKLNMEARWNSNLHLIKTFGFNCSLLQPIPLSKLACSDKLIFLQTKQVSLLWSNLNQFRRKQNEDGLSIEKRYTGVYLMPLMIYNDKNELNDNTLN